MGIGQRQRQFYPAMESCRGLCALIVSFMHMPWTWSLQGTRVIEQGWLFVDFFFVLSGFVIANAFIDRLRSPQDLREFGWRRFFRLYPLHLVTLIAMAMLVAFRFLADPATAAQNLGINRDWWMLAIANVFLVHAWGISGESILNIPSWSISTEAAAYIVFAGVCFAFATVRRRVAAFLILSVLSVLALVIVRPGVGLGGDVTFRLLRCFYSFGLGVVVWWLVDAHQRAGRRDVSGWVQICALVASVAAVLATGKEDPLTLFVPPVFAAAIFALGRGAGTGASRALSAAPLIWLGTVSYSIYLNHFFVELAIDVVWRRMPLLSSVYGSVAWGNIMTIASTAATLMISALTYRFVESPWRRYGQRTSSAIAAAPRDQVCSTQR